MYLTIWVFCPYIHYSEVLDWNTSKYYNYAASRNFWVNLFWPWVSLRNEEKSSVDGRMGCRSIFMYLWFHEIFFPFSHQYDLNFHKYPVKGKSFIFMILQISFSLSQWNFARIWFGIFKEQSDLTHFWHLTINTCVHTILNLLVNLLIFANLSINGKISSNSTMVLSLFKVVFHFRVYLPTK